MSNADGLAPVFQEAAEVFEEEFYADFFRVVRTEKTRDPRGGTTETETEVSSGRCMLTMAGQSGMERLSASRVVGITNYEADFPLGTEIRMDDSVYINDRRFKVVNVVKEGNWATSVQTDLEEWS